MCGLDVVRMIISPSSSHSLGIPMVWDDVAVVRELFVADGAFPVLLDNLPLQEFPHLSWGPEFPISSRVMRVFNPLDTQA